MKAVRHSVVPGETKQGDNHLGPGKLLGLVAQPAFKPVGEKTNKIKAVADSFPSAYISYLKIGYEQ